MPYLAPQASAHAGSIDQVLTLVHVLMLVLFVGWGGYFVWTLVRFRSRRQRNANHVGSPGTELEFAL